MTLLSHYWRADDPAELTAAIGADWAEVLEGLPQEYIQRACIAYMRSEPKRKPTPGAIYNLARSFMPRPEIIQTEEKQPDRVSAEAAREILKTAGFRVNKFGGIDQ